MLAQEGGDRTCLDLAQLWLNFLEEGGINAVEAQVSSKLDTATATNLSVTLQSLIKTSALAGCQPSKLFDLLLRSDTLNCQHRITNLLATGTAERSALWSMYGKNELAMCCTQVMLYSNMKKLGKSYNSDGVCEAICSAALWFGLQGEYNLSTTVLQHAKSRFPRYPLSKYWIITDCYLTSIRCIIAGQWQEAREACTTLYRLDHTLAVLQLASLNIARRNLSKAKELLQALLAMDGIEPLYQVRAQTLLANTMLISPDTVLPGVIDVLTNALALAKNNFLSYEAAIVDAHFAYVLLQMHMPQHGLKSIKAAMEDVLANGSRYDRARVQFLFVRCLIASSDTNERKEANLSSCIKILETAVSDFQQLECYSKVMDVYSFLSSTYHDLNKKDERNKYACKFRLIHEQFPCSREYFDVFH